MQTILVQKVIDKIKKLEKQYPSYGVTTEHDVERQEQLIEWLKNYKKAKIDILTPKETMRLILKKGNKK